MPRHALRIGLIVVAVLIVLIVGAGTAFVLSFNPNDLKPRIIAAVKQATGRDLVLKGRIGLKLALQPTVELSNVTLSNGPGFAAPEMATLQKLDLRLAVLPLLTHRIEIDRLVLVHPDINLETNAQGQSNWEFAPQTTVPAAASAPTQPGSSQPGSSQAGTSQVGTSQSAASQSGTSAPGTSPPGTSAPGTPATISIASVMITDGTVTYRDDRTGRTTKLDVKRLSSTAASPSAPLHLALDATYDGTAFNLAGVIGPLTRLQDPAATTPWPVDVTLTAAGAKVAAKGTLTHPLQGRGYALTLQGSVPDVTALAPLLPGVTLPALHDVSFNTKVADSGGPVPKLSDLTLHVGAGDLGAYVPGLKIDKLDINAPRTDQPIQATGAGSYAGQPVTLAATFGAPAALPAGPFPVDVKAQADGATFEAKGAIAHPQTLGGVGVAITADVPDLSALSPLAGQKLPAIKAVTFQAKLNDAQGGFRQGATLRGIKLTTADGDLSGEVGLTLGKPLALTATLTSTRIDTDALLAAAGKPVQNTRPAGAPAPKPAPAGRLFSDAPLPFGLLRLANGDLTLTVQDLRSGGTDYHAVNLHAALQGGRLNVDRFTADLPGGPMNATLSADASQDAPPIALTMHAPGIEVAPLLSAAGLPGYASGKLQVDADLHGAGVSAHAIAASLDGTLGLAMQGGTIDTDLLNKVLGGALAKANLLGMLAHGGSTEVRCFAARAVVKQGVATLNPLLLNTAALTMDGGGSVNLGTETLDMTLRPQGRIGGTGLVVPMRLTGPIRSPDVAVNALGAAESNVGTLAGAVLGDATPLGLLGGAVLGGHARSGGEADACAGPLALARGEAPPPASATRSQPTASASATPKPPNAGALLNQLFH